MGERTICGRCGRLIFDNERLFGDGCGVCGSCWEKEQKEKKPTSNGHVQAVLCVECGADLGIVLLGNPKGFICGKCFEKQKKHLSVEFLELVN